jgi:hypothetical protein
MNKRDEAMNASPHAITVHNIKGRTRIRIPSMRKHENFFRKLNNEFSSCEWIHEIKPNYKTGSILFVHSSNVYNIKAFAEEKGLFNLSTDKGLSTRIYIKKRVKQSVKGLDKLLKKTSKDNLDLTTTVFLILVSMSAYQILRGRFTMPRWDASLWYAVNFFRFKK